MKRKTANSPYPILYPEECVDIQGYKEGNSFDVGTDFRIFANQNKDLVCQFRLELNNDEIADLVATGKAQYYVNVESAHAYFRKPYHQSSPDFSITLPYKDISDSIELYVGVVAVDGIDSFSMKTFSDKYGQRSFSIEKGHILAVGPSITADIVGMDGVNEPCLMVVRDTNPDNNEIWVDTSKQQLIIHLANGLYEIYANRKSSKLKTELLALILRPAIIQALTVEVLKSRNAMPEGEEELEKRWVRTISAGIDKAIKEKRLDMDFKLEDVRLEQDRGKGTLSWAVSKLLNNILTNAANAMVQNVKGGR